MPRSKGKAARKSKRHVIPKDEREFLQMLHCELIHVRACMVTVALSLDGSGAHDYAATLLRGHALARLEPIMKTLDELAYRTGRP